MVLMTSKIKIISGIGGIILALIAIGGSISRLFINPLNAIRAEQIDDRNMVRLEQNVDRANSEVFQQRQAVREIEQVVLYKNRKKKKPTEEEIALLKEEKRQLNELRQIRNKKVEARDSAK